MENLKGSEIKGTEPNQAGKTKKVLKTHWLPSPNTLGSHSLNPGQMVFFVGFFYKEKTKTKSVFLNQLKQPRLRCQGFLKPMFAIQTRSHHRVETAPLPSPLPRAPAGPGPAPPPHCGLPWSQRLVGRRRRAPPQAGRAKGKIMTAGQGWLSREGSQLGGGWVGIWTKPHCRLNMMPLTYFPVGKPREDAHGATWLRRGTPAWCPHVPSAGFRHPPKSL